MDLIGIERAVRQIVRSVSDMPEKSVIPSNENAPAPEGLFASVFLSDIEKTGHDSSRFEEIEDDEFHLNEIEEGQRIFTASVQFFRSGALAAADKLANRICLSKHLQAMRVAGLGFVDVSAMRDLSSIVSEEWEQRAQVSITFHVVSVETIPIDIYDKFPVSINVDGHISTTEVKPE